MTKITFKQRKIDWAKGECESSWDDYKFINQVLYGYFYSQIKYMTKKQFKEHLETLGIYDE